MPTSLRAEVILGWFVCVLAACGVPETSHPPPAQVSSEGSDGGLIQPPPVDASVTAPPDGGVEASPGGYSNCDTFDPAAVHGTGTLKAGPNGNTVIFNVTTGKWCGPLPGPDVFLRPDGSLLYIGYVGPTLRRFVKDAIVRDGNAWKWSETPSPFENDVLLPSPCPPVGTPRAPHHIRVWADTTDYVYACSDIDPYKSADGTKTYAGAISFGYTSHWLRDFPSFDVMDTNGVATPVTGGVTALTKLTVRAKADGFLYAGTVVGSSVAELWKITFDGNATKVGTYAVRGAGLAPNAAAAMDPDGNLFDSAAAGIFKRPLEPGVHTLVYDTAKEDVATGVGYVYAAP